MLFTWLRLCQDQAICVQTEALVHTNTPKFIELSLVVGLIFNSLVLKIDINHLGALSQLSYAFKHLLNLTDKSSLSLRTPMVKRRQLRPCQGLEKMGDML